MQNIKVIVFIERKIILLIFGGVKMEYNELPLGFAMALAQNPKAMQKFSNFSEEQKKEIINGTHNMHSKEEMQQYVNSLV